MCVGTTSVAEYNAMHFMAFGWVWLQVYYLHLRHNFLAHILSDVHDIDQRINSTFFSCPHNGNHADHRNFVGKFLFKNTAQHCKSKQIRVKDCNRAIQRLRIP